MARKSTMLHGPQELVFKKCLRNIEEISVVFLGRRLGAFISQITSLLMVIRKPMNPNVCPRPLAQMFILLYF